MEVEVNHLQSIEVNHQFRPDADWIIIEEKDFKAISCFNDALQKALVFILMPHEDPKDYSTQLVELTRFLIPYSEKLSPEDFEKQLKNAFEMTQAIMSTSDVVILNLSEKVQELNERLLDLHEQVASIIQISNEIRIKILLYLAINKNGKTGFEINQNFSRMGHDSGEISDAISHLVKSNFITLDQDGKRYVISPDLVRMKSGRIIDLEDKS
ncbi:MAG: hypothetical protein ACTSRA_17450 [Promethearchaeota archaeon]